MICKYRNGAIIDDGVILNACVKSRFVIIDPKAITVSSILRHVRRGRIRNIYTLSDGSAEVIEGEVSSSSELVGPTIEDLHLADGLRIGGILRNNEIIMPRGDTKIKEGDYVTIFSIPSKIHEVEQLFRVSASYY